MPLVQIGNEWEEIFRQYEMRDNNGTVLDVALPPSEITNLVAGINAKLQEAGRQGRYACVTCAGERRRLIRAIMDAKQMRQSVIAYEEITHESSLLCWLLCRGGGEKPFKNFEFTLAKYVSRF
jgi:flagellar biosynthesis protein FlhA